RPGESQEGRGSREGAGQERRGDRATRRHRIEAPGRDRQEAAEGDRRSSGQGQRSRGPLSGSIERAEGGVMGRLRHLRNDERGTTLVFVAVSLMALLSATTLAIDVGMFMNSRSQAQNAADAGALAGATALVFNSFTDRTPTGPAVQSAMNTALANQVIGANVSVKTADVTFPNDPAGNPTRVKVDVYRTDAADRNNPVPTLIGGIFGVKTVNITATATAEASPANAMTCVKPFMIPDQWEEHTAPTSEFN